MVSLRRRRLLGLSSGRGSSLSQRPRFSDSGAANANRSPISTGPASLGDVEMKESNVSVGSAQSSNTSDSSSSSKEQLGEQSPVTGVKRRKLHGRKHSEKQESGLMKGVYFKNMKWQAAIKVDKKQIHLGTVASQEEAAHLYDRAAFLCGRKPNSELSEEEKQELGKFNWEEFLAMTRAMIANKMYKSRAEGGLLVMSSEPSPHNNDQKCELDGENTDVVSPAAAAKEVEAEGDNNVVFQASEQEGENNNVVSPAAEAKEEEAEGGNNVVSPASEQEGENNNVSPSAEAKEEEETIAEGGNTVVSLAAAAKEAEARGNHVVFPAAAAKEEAEAEARGNHVVFPAAAGKEEAAEAGDNNVVCPAAAAKEEEAEAGGNNVVSPVAEVEEVVTYSIA